MRKTPPEIRIDQAIRVSIGRYHEDMFYRELEVRQREWIIGIVVEYLRRGPNWLTGSF